MTLAEFKNVLLAADATAEHNRTSRTGNYTVWQEYGESALYADGVRTVVYKKIQVDRFTKTDLDPVVELIRTALETAGFPYEYLLDYEQDTGYLHHIFDCTVP
jgi:hypothetical protein